MDCIRASGQDFDTLIKHSEASKYGDTIAVIKPNPDTITDTNNNVKDYKKSHYEMFRTGVLDVENHFGIRTGIATTAIDFYVYKGESPEKAEKLFFAIAKSGIYIPVIDENQKLIFSKNNFDSMRKQIFSGISGLSQENIVYNPDHVNPKILKKIIDNMPNSEELERV